MTRCKPISPDPAQGEKLGQGLLLPVMEMFSSIQGEGFHTGKAAAFVRIGGCDVGCHWCDVKEAWDASLHPLTSIGEIIAYVRPIPAKAVVITGGEPLNYPLGPLCEGLRKEGIRIFLETSGACPPSGDFHWICLSPKKNAAPLPEMLQLANELKVIIHDESDFSWAEENAARVSKDCHLFLQAEWSKYHEMGPRIVDHVKKHPRWMVSLQAHKFMNIP